MATVGKALTTPETGWKRFDDSDKNISYSSSVQTYNLDGLYGGSPNILKKLEKQ